MSRNEMEGGSLVVSSEGSKLGMNSENNEMTNGTGEGQVNVEFS